MKGQIEANQEEMKAQVGYLASQMDMMEARMDSSLEEMKASLGPMEACLGKTEVRVETGQDPVEAKIKTGLEERKATSLEANQAEIEAIAEHQEVPNEEAAMETIRALEDRSGDHQPAVGYRNPLKRRG
jgi:hypothetical protein